MKMFTATTRIGLSIITVMAEDKESARVEIMNELNKNPSRKIYIPLWEANGKMVIEVKR